MKTFVINRYLNLKLKDKKTFIHVGDKEILVCKKVGIIISPSKIWDYLKYETIDDLEELNYTYDENLEITPETEFFVHCSNLQIWENNGYNTNLIHSSIAFPVLKELMEMGDLRAKKVFKEEIVKRFISGNRKVQEFLIIEGYIQHLSPLEREMLFGKEYLRFKSLESHIGHRIKIITNCDIHYGVIIQDGKIIGLRLHGEDNKLFPHQIKYFKKLKILCLENFLAVTIPKWFQNFNNLVKLNLINDNLVVIPKSIGKLKNLESLSLRLNSLNKLPQEIESLKNLKKLELSYNQFKEFPKEVLELSQLEELYMSNNQIEAIHPKIGLLRSLRTLGLSSNPISLLPDELLDMPNLKKVFIGNSNVEVDDDFKKELKKRKINMFPSGLLEFGN